MQGIKLNMMRKNKNARHKINMVRKKRKRKGCSKEKRGVRVGFKQVWGICTLFYESSFVFVI